jgi:hypothetical protein
MTTKNVVKSLKGGYKVSPTTTKASEKPTMKPSMKLPSLTGGSSCDKPMLKGGSKKSKKDTKKTKKVKKTKKSKKPMPKGFAYCLMCGKQTEMLNPETRTTKNGRKQMVGEGKCGHKVYRFI